MDGGLFAMQMLDFFKRMWGKLVGVILALLGRLGLFLGPEQPSPDVGEPLPDMPEPPQTPETPGDEGEPTPPIPEPAPEPQETQPAPVEPEPEEELPVLSTPLEGKGIWIWRMVMAEDGNVARIIERAKDADLRWIAIKGGDGSSWWSQLTKTVVHELQNAGLKVFGWVYTYGSNPENEAAVAIHVLDLGCNGLIVDAEREYEGKPSNAEVYMRTIRAAHPSAFIAYSTFPLISLHPTFPYIEFGRYCDAFMPQCYWKDIGLGPREMVRRTREEWTDWVKDLRNSGREQSVVPLFPVGQGYRVTGDEIAEFIEAASGFSGISLWVWNEMTREMWDALAGRPRRMTPPAPPLNITQREVHAESIQPEEIIPTEAVKEPDEEGAEENQEPEEQSEEKPLVEAEEIEVQEITAEDERQECEGFEMELEGDITDEEAEEWLELQAIDVDRDNMDGTSDIQEDGLGEEVALEDNGPGVADNPISSEEILN